MPYNPNVHHRKSIRLKGYDYSQEGAYFITICTHKRECLFGKIENDELQLNDFGKIVFDEWQRTPEKRPNIELGEFAVMPNHFHAIIIIAETRRGAMLAPSSQTRNNTPEQTQDEMQGVYNTPKQMQGVCNTPKQIQGVCNTPKQIQGVCNTPKQIQGVCNTPLREMPVGFRTTSQTVGAIVRGFKSAVSKQIGFSAWQRNYYEHIIRNEKSYQTISEYILNNPVKWREDKFYVT